MSATLATPDIHRWVDKLSPAQTERLRTVVENDETLPTIESSDLADSPLENWLRTTVAATYDRMMAGQEQSYSIDEVRDWLEARRQKAA